MTMVGGVSTRPIHIGFVRSVLDRPARPAAVSTRLIVAAECVAAATPLTLWAVPAEPAWWMAATAMSVIGAATAMVRTRTRTAAYRAGCAAERARCLRLLHDTALQSLEAMALAGEADRLDPAEALVEARGAARRQAALLRRDLGELSGGGSATGPDRGQRLSLTDVLSDVIGEVPVDGPRVELVVGADLPPPAPWQRDCLRDATREALTNVVKHAAARRVVVRVAAVQDGVEVIVRDDGRGFDPARTLPGFGTRQSITARIREAGGEASIDSGTGRGTRVRLWMPVRLTTTHPRRRPRR